MNFRIGGVIGTAMESDDSTGIHAVKDNYPRAIEHLFKFVITRGQKPERLDIFLTRTVQNATRNKVQKAIDEGMVTVNGKVAKSSRKIYPDDEIVCRILKPPPIELLPENIPLDIIYEDDYILVLNKPAGMVTHPGYGNRYGTVVNALLYYFGKRESISIEVDDEEEELDEGVIYSSDEIRPGIVHRLDKDTSGLMVVAKTPEAHVRLSSQFSDKSIQRTYIALVWGRIEKDGGTIDENIGRSPKDRKLFAVVSKGGKDAVTDYSVVERFEYMTLVAIKLRTGRTHQIRVHFSHLRHPVFGDQSYSGDKVMYGHNDKKWRDFTERQIKEVNRQLLHAQELKLIHPVSNERMIFTAPLPSDMGNFLQQLKKISDNKK